MSNHEPFRFETLQELRGKIQELGVDISLEEDLSPLHRQVSVGKYKTTNALTVLPMEGCDSQPDGSPGEWVERRYLRFA